MSKFIQVSCPASLQMVCIRADAIDLFTPDSKYPDADDRTLIHLRSGTILKVRATMDDINEQLGEPELWPETYQD